MSTSTAYQKLQKNDKSNLTMRSRVPEFSDGSDSASLRSRVDNPILVSALLAGLIQRLSPIPKPPSPRWCAGRWLDASDSVLFSENSGFILELLAGLERLPVWRTKGNGPRLSVSDCWYSKF